jgi:hypothetical protein
VKGIIGKTQGVKTAARPRPKAMRRKLDRSCRGGAAGGGGVAGGGGDDDTVGDGRFDGAEGERYREGAAARRQAQLVVTGAGADDEFEVLGLLAEDAVEIEDRRAFVAFGGGGGDRVELGFDLLLEG